MDFIVKQSRKFWMMKFFTCFFVKFRSNVVDVCINSVGNDLPGDVVDRVLTAKLIKRLFKRDL